MNDPRSLDDYTAACIRCGFCLESCPTFQITGEETESPRGRIYLVRSAEEGKISWADVAPHIDKCLGCRACETACPSGVQYGRIFELAKARTGIRLWRKILVSQLTNAQKAKRQFKLAGLFPGRRLPIIGIQAPRPQPVLLKPELQDLPPVVGQVALLRGCVMDALFPNVHDATIRLLRRLGFETIQLHGQCCGALNAHTGDPSQAEQKFDQMVNEVPHGMLLLTNSAGCGSHLKENGANAQDVSEFLMSNGLIEVLRGSPGIAKRVSYHDACHLAHGQGIRSQPRELIKAIPHIIFVELPNSDRCCGSAGIYNIQQPKIATELLHRKWDDIQSIHPEIVVSGNPGCHAWIEQGRRDSVRVLHTIELLEASFSGLP